jgi:hypothetical protein
MRSCPCPLGDETVGDDVRQLLSGIKGEATDPVGLAKEVVDLVATKPIGLALWMCLGWPAEILRLFLMAERATDNRFRRAIGQVARQPGMVDQYFSEYVHQMRKLLPMAGTLREWAEQTSRCPDVAEHREIGRKMLSL